MNPHIFQVPHKPAVWTAAALFFTTVAPASLNNLRSDAKDSIPNRVPSLPVAATIAAPGQASSSSKLSELDWNSLCQLYNDQNINLPANFLKSKLEMQQLWLEIKKISLDKILLQYDDCDKFTSLAISWRYIQAAQKSFERVDRSLATLSTKKLPNWGEDLRTFFKQQYDEIRERWLKNGDWGKFEELERDITQFLSFAQAYSSLSGMLEEANQYRSAHTGELSDRTIKEFDAAILDMRLALKTAKIKGNLDTLTTSLSNAVLVPSELLSKTREPGFLLGEGQAVANQKTNRSLAGLALTLFSGGALAFLGWRFLNRLRNFEKR